MPMAVPPLPERHVKLFKKGRNQVVRIPREFGRPADVILRKEADLLNLEPTHPTDLPAGGTGDAAASRRGAPIDP